MSNDTATSGLATQEMFPPEFFQNPYPFYALLRDHVPVHPVTIPPANIRVWLVTRYAGRIATGAGSSAGIDLALTLVAEFAGPELSQGIQLALEHYPRPPFDSGSPSKADKPIVDAVSFMMHAFEKEWSHSNSTTGQVATASRDVVGHL